MARSLTFAQLREANTKRLPLFKNRQGGPAHSALDGSDWSPSDWVLALVGEVGELAGLLKGLKRGDFTDLAAVQLEIAKEIADIQCYLDILAKRLGVDLGKATAAKFNEVSHRVGCDIFLPE